LARANIVVIDGDDDDDDEHAVSSYMNGVECYDTGDASLLYHHHPAVSAAQLAVVRCHWSSMLQM